MTRTTVGIVAALVLGVGIVLGLGVGYVLTSGSPSPAPSVAVVATQSPAPSVTSTPTLSPSPTPLPTPSPSPTPPPTPTPEPTPVLFPAPLTGKPVTEALAERHVVAVMIDDLSAARPQAGLSRAGVVWHAPAEGGIPRYMALFGDQGAPLVGPIRSARMYYIGWAAEWKAAYVHAGGSPQAINYLRSPKGRGAVVYDANPFYYGQRYAWRVRYRSAPHNLYSDAKHLRTFARKVGAKPVNGQDPVWQFAPDAEVSQRPKGGKIIVPYRYNRIEYRYDRKTNTYPRFVSVEGKQVDAGTKDRIAPKNVVIMVMRFGPLNDGSNKGRLEAQYIGEGPAWIATNGKTIKGTWRKKSMTAPTLFFDRKGRPVTLTIGQTFIQVVQRGTTITIRDGKVPAPAPSPTVGPSGSGAPAPTGSPSS